NNATTEVPIIPTTTSNATTVVAACLRRRRPRSLGCSGTGSCSSQGCLTEGPLQTLLQPPRWPPDEPAKLRRRSSYGPVHGSVDYMLALSSPQQDLHRHKRQR